MRIWLFDRYRAGAAVAGLALLCTPSPAVASGFAAGVHPSTRANVLDAMHGEALAYATYSAYAVQAEREHLRAARRVFLRTAAVERGEHFNEEASLIGFVRGDAANLRTAIAGESAEATRMYPRFAAEARADGDAAAARLFAEISRDEGLHSRLFARALKAVTRPWTGVVVPAGPIAHPKAIPAGPPRVSSSRTLRNLRTAMRGEAFAYAAYSRYARHAAASGRRRLALLFTRTAKVELTEHFAEEATLAGLVRKTRTNLRRSIAGETYEATRLYPRYARRAAAVGDQAAAMVLRSIAHDEAGHARAFRRVLHHLGHGCSGCRSEGIVLPR